MAQRYICELPSATDLSDDDYFVIDDSQHNYKITWGAIKTFLGTVVSFVPDPDTEHYPGFLTITLANGAVLRAKAASDDSKQDVLTFDSTPTAGSENPVTSGGVHAALQLKFDAANYVAFHGATEQSAGEAGIVPAPTIPGLYLASDGSWLEPDITPQEDSGKLITSGAVFAALEALGIDGKIDIIVAADEYAGDSTYAVDDYCMHDGALYRCSTAITTAEDWTAAHWTAVQISGELKRIAQKISTVETGLADANTDITKLLARTDMEAGSVTLTNNQVFPFNSSQVTVPLSTTRDNQNYIVDYEVTAAVGNVGDIIVSAKLVNGFKIEYTGSASSVTVKYQVLGGMS